MDGIEIANRSVDHIISFLLKKSFEEFDNKNKEEDDEE
jgi:hypothetical protein